MNKPRLSMIAAIGMPGRILGSSDGSLPWYLPEDFKHFKEITTGHPIIMGRKTWEDIARRTNGAGLPNRQNIIVSREIDRSTINNPEQVFWGKSILTAIVVAEKVANAGNDEIFIIGGGEIYRQTIELVDYLYLTVVHGVFEGDIVFPEFVHLFEEPEIVDLLVDDNSGLHFKFLEFERKRR